jgi:metal-responsive CopG/Arc/MetJ family transcriptional regulator
MELEPVSETRPERKTERVPVLMSPSAVKQIDEMRFSTRLGSRAEAIRRLIQKGIEAAALESSL